MFDPEPLFFIDYQQTEVLEKIARHQKADENYIEQGIKLLEIAGNAAAFYRTQEPARKELLKATFLRDLRESLERIRETQRMSNEAEELFEEIQGVSGMTFSDLTSEDKRREQKIKSLIQEKKNKQTIFERIDDEVREQEHQLADRLQETINSNAKGKKYSMNDPEFTYLFQELISLPNETEWVEFKLNYVRPEEIGEYLSALIFD